MSADGETAAPKFPASAFSFFFVIIFIPLNGIVLGAGIGGEGTAMGGFHLAFASLSLALCAVIVIQGILLLRVMKGYPHVRPGAGGWSKVLLGLILVIAAAYLACVVVSVSHVDLAIILMGVVLFAAQLVVALRLSSLARRYARGEWPNI